MKKVLIIGRGSWGKKLASVVQKLGHNPVVASRDWESKLEGVTHAVIASPAPSHAEIAQKLLKLDIDCLIEKPAALTKEQANLIRKASEESGAKVFCHTPYLYHNLNSKLIEKVNASSSTYSYRSIRKNVEGNHADGNSFINHGCHDLANLWSIGARSLELSYVSKLKDSLTISLHNVAPEERCRRAYITTGEFAERKTRYINIEKDKSTTYQLVDDKFLIKCSELDESLLPTENAIEYSLKDFIEFTHAPCDIEFIEWAAGIIETVSLHLGTE